MTTPARAYDARREQFRLEWMELETGLDYFGARYFSGAQGRFTSPDPIAMTSDRIVDPQQLNMYAYARNNPLKYIDPKGEELNLAQLSEEDRQKLIAELQKQSGLQLNYNAKSGLLEIAGRLKGGSATYREGLTALIGDSRTFNVLNQSEYSADGQTAKVGFGLYDPKNRNIVIDFKDFSDKRPEINLGLVFYHEGVAHGMKRLADSSGFFGWSAPLDTGKVADELGLPAPNSHDVERRGDRYFIRVTNPLAPSGAGRLWQQITGRGSTPVDVTDVVKQK
jgi:RHS repeat-associated protein